MNNIIQLIEEKVKGEIEKNIEKILKGSLNLDEMVDLASDLLNKQGLSILEKIIEEINQEIKNSFDRENNYLKCNIKCNTTSN